MNCTEEQPGKGSLLVAEIVSCPMRRSIASSGGNSTEARSPKC
jgi:hypothetical protein